MNPGSPASAGAVANIDHVNAGRDVIAVAGDYVASPSVPASPLHQLPPPLGDFTGRKSELAELMGHHQSGLAISGLRGLGGIGKTVLALVLADRLKSQYPDAQFYLDLKGAGERPLTPSDAMAHVIRAYHPDQRLPDDEGQLRSFYLSLLDGKRAILLMDNAKDSAQLLPLIPPSTCTLIVTSRQHFTLPGIHALNLDILPTGDAIALLIKICPRLASNQSTIERLARLCGHLPLALRAAGSLLAVRPDIAVGEYLGDLSNELTRLEAIGSEGVELTVAASFNLTYKQLEAETARVFRGLSVFPGSFDAEAEAETCQDPKNTHLGRLLVYSLVNFDPTTDRYGLHDLVRLFAASKLSSPQPSAVQGACWLGSSPSEDYSTHLRHAQHYFTIARSTHTLYEQGGPNVPLALSLFDREFPNMQAGFLWSRDRAFASLPADAIEKLSTPGAERSDAPDPPLDRCAARLCCNYANAGRHLLSLRLHPRDWIMWLTAALAAARHLHDRTAEGCHLGNLGVAYFASGEPRRAIEYHERDLAIAREIGDRRGEGTALGNLGNAYAVLGEPRSAIKFYEQHLTITRETGDRRGEGYALCNLGNGIYALGEARHAVEFYEQALAIARETGDRRLEANALCNLGNAHYALGDLRRTIKYHEQDLAIAREIGDQRGEAKALGNLGVAHAALGDTRRAIEYHEQDLAIAGEIGDRLGYAMASWNLGDEYAKQGNLPAAIPAMQLRVDYEREINHPDAEKHAAHVESLRAKLNSSPHA